MSRCSRLTGCLAVFLAAALTFSAAHQSGPALADENPSSASANTVESTESSPQATLSFGTNVNEEPKWRQFIGGDVEEVWAHSPSMDRNIPLIVLRADDSKGPRPVLYLLNGADGGESTANWLFHTDALDYYRSKNINLVIPMQGYRSFYTDWIQDSERLGGKQKWETFLTQELPGPLEKALNTNGKRAIAGVSMSATTTILYAQHHPGFYNAVASFSGCQQTSGFLGDLTTNLVIASYGDPTMMWGDMNSDTWRYNDIFANIEKLRGQTIYVANGSMTFGPYDLVGSPFLWEGVTSIDSVVNGGIIEGVSNICAHNFQAKLKQANIPATFDFTAVGTHSWGYWQDDLRRSWNTIGPAIGA
ncbi:MAG: alpha/beta hydrolase family protein [Corynebacterium sp.]|nr:alpha/beta hydrolase family protein [Corynebacterium sp.]